VGAALGCSQLMQQRQSSNFLKCRCRLLSRSSPTSQGTSPQGPDPRFGLRDLGCRKTSVTRWPLFLQKTRVSIGIGEAMIDRPSDGSESQITVFEGQWEVHVDRRFVPSKVVEEPPVVGMTKGGRKPSASLSGLLRRENSSLFDVAHKVQGDSAAISPPLGSSALPKTNEGQSEDSTCSELGSDGINEEHDSPCIPNSAATSVTDPLGRITVDMDGFSEAEVPKGLVFEGSFEWEVKEYSPARFLAQRPGGSAPALDQALVQSLPVELQPPPFPTPFHPASPSFPAPLQQQQRSRSCCRSSNLAFSTKPSRIRTLQAPAHRVRIRLTKQPPETLGVRRMMTGPSTESFTVQPHLA